MYKIITPRHRFYGKLKYKLCISNFISYRLACWVNSSDIISWCIKTYSDDQYEFERRNALNYIYLKGDDELSLFLLKWTVR